MSTPPAHMVAFPVVALWVAPGGALSVPAAIVALGLVATITMACFIAGRFSLGKGSHQGGPPPR